MSRHTKIHDRWARDTETEELQAERLYCVTGSTGMGETYAWSPDGEGVFWYDTYDDAVSEHGEHPVYHVNEITDF